MFTIDFVTSRKSDTPVERVEFDGRTLEGAVSAAETILHTVAATIPRGGAPVIGYLIRDEAGTVMRRQYRGII